MLGRATLVRRRDSRAGQTEADAAVGWLVALVQRLSSEAPPNKRQRTGHRPQRVGSLPTMRLAWAEEGSGRDQGTTTATALSCDARQEGSLPDSRPEGQGRAPIAGAGDVVRVPGMPRPGEMCHARTGNAGPPAANSIGRVSLTASAP